MEEGEATWGCYLQLNLGARGLLKLWTIAQLLIVIRIDWKARKQKILVIECLFMTFSPVKQGTRCESTSHRWSKFFWYMTFHVKSHIIHSQIFTQQKIKKAIAIFSLEKDQSRESKLKFQFQSSLFCFILRVRT